MMGLEAVLKTLQRIRADEPAVRYALRQAAMAREQERMILEEVQEVFPGAEITDAERLEEV